MPGVGQVKDSISDPNQDQNPDVVKLKWQVKNSAKNTSSIHFWLQMFLSAVKSLT